MRQFKLVDYIGREEETVVLHERDLRETLNQMQKEEARVVSLLSPEGDCLAIGVGNPYGCIMYMNKSGAPPYCWAVEDMEGSGEYIEFNVEGTLTPIPLHRCLPFERVVDIAIYYFNNEKLPEYVAWEED